MSQPSLRTTVVGSYPIPSWLAAYPSTPNLRDAIMVVLKTQELARVDVIADGELSRFDVNHPETNGMIEYFVRPLQGIDRQWTREELNAFRAQAGMGFRTQPAAVVRGPIGEGTLTLAADFARVRGLTHAPLKFTVTSPYMLAKTLLDCHYRDREALLMALADALHAQVTAIDADVLQVDEANLPGAPEDGLLAAKAINRVLSAAKRGKAVHLCFGNYGGQSIQRGDYEALLPFLNALECDHLVLEFARRQFKELDLMKELKQSISLGVGVIDIKDNEIESAEVVARRIEHCTTILGAERIQWIHPDCGFWMLPRNVADGKMRAMAEGRDLYLGIKL
ncbi:MAG: hypothetical protein AMXMBFR84_05530 [Candidatus Hydrogenedentota bacterium]